MKKIGILTINDDTNYGNRLQNYAVQKIIEKFDDVSVETILNQEGIYGKYTLIKKIKDIIKKIMPLKKFKRIGKFILFNENIKFYKIRIDKNNVLDSLNNEFDYFFTGSDQVWNPTFGRMSDIDFLSFADKSKRNSFAASFGINDIPDNLKRYYKEKLERFNNISVREDRGKVIIEELTGRTDVEVLVDPTMLLTANEWDKVSKKPKQLKVDKYILNYFLGELSEERKNEITRIAKENNCEVINILDKKSPFYQTGPSEFLYLEKNAFLICTDSFHSSVFAIIYDRPFIVFDREDKEVKMNSRLDTLINKFKLKNRRFQGKITKENLKHDYIEAYKILKEEKLKSNRFLRKSLDID